jgi:hypothetical protein
MQQSRNLANIRIVVDLLDLEKQNWLAAKLLKDFSVLFSIMLASSNCVL